MTEMSYDDVVAAARADERELVAVERHGDRAVLRLCDPGNSCCALALPALRPRVRDDPATTPPRSSLPRSPILDGRPSRASEGCRSG
jgi:hypothetical protein